MSPVHDYVIDNSTGANVRADINSVLQAILTNNSSSSAPSTTAAYMWWADTTNGVLKIRNSSNNDWVELLQLDGTLTLEDGSASTPGLAFRDDLNTGIFSSAADTFEIATGGTQRFQITSNGTINFNANARIQNDGILRSADGDASRPAYNFLSDNDNGMFRATTNTIAFSTAGSERMRLDSSGRVLINTTAQSTGSNSANAILTVNSQVGNATSGAILALRRGQASASISQNHTLGRIVFCDSQAGEYAFIEGEADLGSNGVGDTAGRIAFSTSADGSSAPTERMRIDSSGRVMIGLTSSNVPFQINATATSFGGQSTVGVFGDITSFAAGVGGGITFSGRYNSSSSQVGFAAIRGIKENATDGDHDGALTFSSRPDQGNMTERMRIDSSGRLLLGTTTEGAAGADEFTIAGTGNTGFTIRSGNTSEGNIFFSDGTSGGDEYRGVIRYAHNGNQFEFFTDGSRQLILDSSGRLLIGIDSSIGGIASHLQVVESDGGKLAFARNDTTVSANADLGKIQAFGNDNNGSYQEVAAIKFQADLNHGNNDKPGRISFLTTSDGGSSSIERMRLNSSGNLIVAGTSTVSRAQAVFFQVGEGSNSFGIQRNNGSNVIEVVTEVGTTSGRSIQNFFNPNGSVGSIQVSGSSTSFNTSSDYRLKENEVPISDGITRLKTLKPYRFNFKADASTTVDGFFAHEVTAVPEAISGEKDAVREDGSIEPQGIDQSKLVPLLVAAVKELITKVEALEAA